MSDAQPNFRIPDWVPPPVGEAALRCLYKFPDPNDTALIRRLATDVGMKEVWRVLGRQNRRTGIPELYRESDTLPLPPLRIPRSPEVRRIIQEYAMAELFVWAVVHSKTASRAISRAEFDELSKPYVELGSCLQDNLTRLEKLGIGRPADLAVLFGLSVECARRVTFLREKLSVVDRPSRSNLEHRGYIAALARTTRQQFGKVLLGTVATIASVTLEAEVTVAMVRVAIRDT